MICNFYSPGKNPALMVMTMPFLPIKNFDDAWRTRMGLYKDPVLVDSYVAELMGYLPRAIKHIDMAARFGVGSPETAAARIREFGKPRFQKIPDQDNARLNRLRAHISERQACSACYGSTIYALQRLEESKNLRNLSAKICLGQGYRGKKVNGLGIGSCTRGFSKSLDGCPPTARQIYEFLASAAESRSGA